MFYFYTYLPLVLLVYLFVVGSFLTFKLDLDFYVWRYFFSFSFFLLQLIIFFLLIHLFLNDITVYIIFEPVLILGDLVISWDFLLDYLSLPMLLLVLTISMNVFFYTFYYLRTEEFIFIFLIYLNIFVFFMLILILSSNLIQLFLGWEGVGICSYLLINFWSTRISAIYASLKAIVYNKVGDCFLLLAICIIYHYTNSFSYHSIFMVLPLLKNFCIFNFYFIDFIFLCFFFGLLSKSAQIGLHCWLADAMEGPTPVSALLHAATMVTAGIFLLLRFAPILEQTTPIYKNLLVLTGLITIFYTGLISSSQYDIKKIIAYSTSNQLGYMLIGCGSQVYNLTLYHLINHGFFKASLFLSSGLIIHSLQGEQDIRKLYGLNFLFPITYSIFFLNILALAGIPFFSGFISKESILLSLLNNYFFFFLGLGTLPLTIFYSGRLIFYTYNANTLNYNLQHKLNTSLEVEFFNILPLLRLSLYGVFSGFLLNLHFNKLSPISIFVETEKFFTFTQLGFTNLFLSYPLIIIIFSYILILIFFFTRFLELNYFLRVVSVFTNTITLVFFFNNFYNSFATPVKKISFFFYYFDKVFLEKFGPRGLIELFSFFSFFSSISLYKLNFNHVINYIYTILLFLFIYFQI